VNDYTRPGKRQTSATAKTVTQSRVFLLTWAACWCNHPGIPMTCIARQPAPARPPACVQAWQLCPCLLGERTSNTHRAELSRLLVNKALDRLRLTSSRVEYPPRTFGAWPVATPLSWPITGIPACGFYKHAGIDKLSRTGDVYRGLSDLTKKQPTSTRSPTHQIKLTDQCKLFDVRRRQG
jgi:hypothetical protein